MRLALANFFLSTDIGQNLDRMEQIVRLAAGADADLLLFPEAAPTGLYNNDDPRHDLPLANTVPGPITRRLGRLAVEQRLWLATGILEREGSCLYDSAVILDSCGDIRLHYRRMQPQWHAADADPAIYRQGNTVCACESPWGRLGLLLCGDLFDDAICDRLRGLSPDLLLFPFARNFGDGSYDQRRWDEQELPEYLARAQRIGCPAAMVNELADRSTSVVPAFGGAWLCDTNGIVVASHALGSETLLVAELSFPITRDGFRRLNCARSSPASTSRQ